MGISNEAAYLYVYSKELTRTTALIKRLSKKAEKYAKKFHEETNVERKIKHKIKHANIRDDILKLQKEHNRVIKILQKHQVAFAHQLTQQHKI